MRILRFGVFELDTQSGELRRHGLKIRLPEQAFQILRTLLERRGDVVTRDELRHRLWTADTFVDFEVGLNNAIRKLREALDDSADNPRFVETLPRRGYRFIAAVESATTEQILESDTGATTRRRASRWWIAAGLVLTVTSVALVVVYERASRKSLGARSAAAPIRSLAVLPFENLTGDPEQKYFVDGITDALTTDLAQVGGFDVVSRTSAMQYERAKKPLPAIGHELNVDALLQGAVVRSGSRVRISAQLIHAATDRHAWARTFESELSGLLTLQQQIAQAIATAIQGRLALRPPLRAARPQTVDPQAYESYLRGVTVGGRANIDAYRHAIVYFEEAIARQPDFALAYALMAQAHLQFLYGGPLPPRAVIPKAEAAVRKALELDDSLALAHRLLGIILHRFYWQWDEAEKEFERARALGDDRSSALENLAQRVSPEEAIAAAERMRRLDPLSFNAYLDLAAAYRAAGQYERAIAEIRRAFEIIPGQNRAHFQLGVTYVFMNRLNDAIGELETAVTANQSNQRFQAYLGYAYAAAGRAHDARRILRELDSRARQQYVSSFGIALIHDALGETEPALAAIERAHQDHAIEFAQMAQYPRFKTIAPERRFQAVMQQIGLTR